MPETSETFMEALVALCGHKLVKLLEIYKIFSLLSIIIIIIHIKTLLLNCEFPFHYGRILCQSLCSIVWSFVSRRSLPEWAWPAALIRWWHCTRPPRMTSCCVCSEGSCAPTRIEWASWWEPWWTTLHGQLHNQVLFIFFVLPFLPHGFLRCRLWNSRRELLSSFSDIWYFD